MAEAGPVSVLAGTTRLAVRLTPKAGRSRIEGLQPEADGGRVLKVSVTAVPEDGKANKALIDLLAKRWKLPKSSFEIVQGATDRRKTLAVDVDPDLLRRLIEDSLP